MTILIVDDYDPFILGVTELLLRRKERVTVLQASNCAEAIHELENQIVDCVLMDEKLAGDSGVDCIREIRQAGYNGALVMLTGYANEVLAVQAIKMGADDFLHKDQVAMALPDIIDKAIAERAKIAAKAAQVNDMAQQKQQDMEKLLLEMDQLAAKVKAHLGRK